VATPSTRARERQPLPPPLPPESRTVGQLVAETIRVYGRRFWPSLALGVGPALFAVIIAELDRTAQIAAVVLVGPVVLSASFVGACVIISGTRPSRPQLLTALTCGIIAYLPVPFLALLLVVPALMWLAFIGLAVPVAVIEGAAVRRSFDRAMRLARADYLHALGSLAALAVVVFLTQSVLFFLLRSGGEMTLRIAAFLAQLVISPLLFLGPALLYYDQAARLEVRSGSPR
jgi:hypothetical protein